MRHITIIITLFFCINYSFAQGVYQLWGTTAFGGSSVAGSIYSLDSTGNNFRNRFSLPGSNSGIYTSYSKMIKINTKYYGCTRTPDILFEWDPASNTFTKKIDLAAYGLSESSNIAVKDNKIYGMTGQDNKTGGGVIFEWDPLTNIFLVRKYLTTIDGNHPQGGLTLSGDKFYGLTELGGINDQGVIFEWDPVTNVYIKKIDFGGSNGANPTGNLVLESGTFYGTISLGSPGLFQWNPLTNAYAVKIELATAGIGGQIEQDLVFNNGKWYGTTTNGGLNNGGVIFEWDPLTNVCVKRTDINPTGLYSNSDLVWLNGKFYGTTSDGGVSDLGVIFEWDPVSNAIIRKADLTTPPGIASPGLLTPGENGVLYGIASGRPDQSIFGTLYQFEPVTGSVTKKIAFDPDNNGKYPVGQIAYLNGTFYGVTDQGGSADRGTLFEWKPGTTGFTKQKSFVVGGNIGYNPQSGLTAKDGKLFGRSRYSYAPMVTNPGLFYEWDPVSDVVVPRVNDIAPGFENPESFSLYNGKFYGLIDNTTTIFEWDPSISTITEKNSLGLSTSYGDNYCLTLFNDKFYGVINRTDDNDAGGLFEWDPVNNIYSYKYDMQSADGAHPFGAMAAVNGLLYGVTTGGGTNDAGVIFEWNTATNTYTKKFDMAVATGSVAKAGLIASGTKLYGVTSEGGSYNKGVIFEWDPISSTYTVKHHFNGEDCSSPLTNKLMRVPALISTGLPGTCTSPLSVTIDNTNNNAWVPLVDINGDVVAEINAHGNNLGIVNYQLYIHDGAIREDATGKLYLNRNLTITPAVQPTTAVDVRFYITEAEYQALRGATNSLGQPSGINTINDVQFIKNGSSCSGILQSTATVVPAVASVYENGYVLNVSLTSFSSFYFTTKTNVALPLTLLGLKAYETGNDVTLDWKTENEINTKNFLVEKSTDGTTFSLLGTIAATGNLNNNLYHYVDRDALLVQQGRLYYRLKMRDRDGRHTYSDIVTLSIGKKALAISLYPNPANGNISAAMRLPASDKLQLRVLNNTGQILFAETINAGPGNISLVLPTNKFTAGHYWLEVKGNSITQKIMFVIVR